MIEVSPPASLPEGTFLLVIPWSPTAVGGVSTVVRQLREQWLGAAQATDLAVESWPDKSPRWLGDEMHFRFSAFGGRAGWRVWAGLPVAAITLMRTARLLRRHGICAINFHYPSLNALGVALLKQWGLFDGGLVLSFHGTDVHRAASRFEQWAWRTAFTACDAITVCSRSLGDRLQDQMGAPAEKLHVAYNGVDAQTFNAVGDASGFESPQVPFERYVVSIGNYIPRKAHRLLLDAFQALQEPGLGLVIAGMDGPERALLAQQAARCGVSDRVLLLCDLTPPQVAELLRRSTFAVQPSLDEPFGLAVIEAAASGAPVAVSGVGGHLEIVQDGRTGWVFPPASAEACAATMRRMLDDPEECQRRADALRHEVLDRFSWQRCARQYQRLLNAPAARDASASAVKRAP